MPDSNKLGTAYLEVEARTAKAKQELEEFKEVGKSISEQMELEASGIGYAFEETGAKISDASRKARSGTKGIAGGLSQVAQAATKTQAALSTLLIPVALVSSLVAVAGQLRKIGEETDRVRKKATDAVQAVKDDISKASLDRVSIGPGAESRAAMDRYRKQIEGLQEELDKLGEKNQSVFGYAFRFATGNQIRHTMNDLNEAIREIQDAQFKEIQKTHDRTVRQQADASAAAVRAAKEIMGEFEEPSSHPVDVLARELETKIDELREIRDSLEGEAAAQVNQIVRRANAESWRLTDELGEKLRAKRRAEIDAEIESIERETLSPLQREIAVTQDRISDLKEELETTVQRREQRDKTNELLATLGTKLERLQKEQMEAMKELPVVIEQAVDRGVQQVLSKTGLISVNQTLQAINANQDRLADEFSRLQ